MPDFSSSLIAEGPSHLNVGTPITGKSSTDGGWLMYSKNDHDMGDDDRYWFSNAYAAMESMERAGFKSQTQQSLGTWEFSDVYAQNSQVSKEARRTTAKRSRRSRPFLLKLIDPVTRVAGPAAIVLSIMSIVAALAYQSGQFTLFQPVSQERQTACTAPTSHPVIHIVKAHRIVRRVSPHQHLALASHCAEPEVLIPAATNLEHRHAYQTYR